MPRGPKGEKRPADANQRAVMVARIAIGELREDVEHKKETEAAIMGRKGGQARAAKLSSKERRRIATNAAAARWKKKKAAR
jgi:hypothetical protein